MQTRSVIGKIAKKPKTSKAFMEVCLENETMKKRMFFAEVVGNVQAPLFEYKIKNLASWY
jgi:hypothetical protein